MKSILDRAFRYTPSARTDIRKSRMKWLRQYARDWDDAHSENAFRNMMPVNVSAIAVKRVA